MRRFDWRRFEPQHARDRDREELDLDQAHWPPVVGENLLERYHSPDERRQTINGLEAWDHFVRRLLAEPDVFPPPQELTHRRLTIVDEFFAAVANPFPKPPIPCVFVSHQRLDTHRGERVACLVDDHGLDSWLDVHDPTLMRVNALASQPLRSILIALIVEIVDALQVLEFQREQLVIPLRPGGGPIGQQSVLTKKDIVVLPENVLASAV